MDGWLEIDPEGVKSPAKFKDRSYGVKSLHRVSVCSRTIPTIVEYIDSYGCLYWSQRLLALGMALVNHQEMPSAYRSMEEHRLAYGRGLLSIGKMDKMVA